MPSWQLATEGIWISLHLGSRAWMSNDRLLPLGRKNGELQMPKKQQQLGKQKLPEEETTGLSFSG